MLNFKGSAPLGLKAEVRQSESPYDHGFSVFTWCDDGTSVILWREEHELTWDSAYNRAVNWLTVNQSKDEHRAV